MQKEIIIKTAQPRELVDITEKIKEAIWGSQVGEGVCLIFVPHTTAAVLINENEPGFKEDMTTLLEKIIPEGSWIHNKVDNNATAHLAASLLGQSVHIPIKDKFLQLGTWQHIHLIELDGPRERRVLVEIISSK